MAPTEQQQQRIDLAALRKDVADLSTQVVGGLARLEGKFETIEATLTATATRNREEIDTLFHRSNEHVARISAIERDYVPDSDLRQHAERGDKAHDEIKMSLAAHITMTREDITRMNGTIDGIKQQLTKILAIGGVVWALLTIGIQMGFRFVFP